MLAQQSIGATAFAYYGPQYFKLLVGGGNKDLLLTGIFGAVKVVACGIFVLFLADRVGRRMVLIGGAAFMAACQITTAIVVKTIPPPEQGNITSSGIATVALIYLFVIAYNFSWGPLPWPYISEYGSLNFCSAYLPRYPSISTDHSFTESSRLASESLAWPSVLRRSGSSTLSIPFPLPVSDPHAPCRQNLSRFSSILHPSESTNSASQI